MLNIVKEDLRGRVANKEFEYKIPSRPTRKHFIELVNIIVSNEYELEDIVKVVRYCRSKNPRFSSEIFYNAIENKYAMLD